MVKLRRVLSDDQLEAFRTTFHTYEKDEALGTVPTSSVAEIFEILKTPFDAATLETYMKKLDVKNTGRLDFDQFAKLIAKFIPDEPVVFSTAEKESFQASFAAFATISRSSVAEILQIMEKPFDDKTLDTYMTALDVNKTGHLNFDKFISFMAQLLPADSQIFL